MMIISVSLVSTYIFPAQVFAIRLSTLFFIPFFIRNLKYQKINVNFLLAYVLLLIYIISYFSINIINNKMQNAPLGWWLGLLGSIYFFQVGKVIASTDNTQKIMRFSLNLFTTYFVIGVVQNLILKETGWDFLRYLRPNPAFVGQGTDSLYLVEYSGWSGPLRAYSVWFEPSFASIMIATSLSIGTVFRFDKFVIFNLISILIFSYLAASKSVFLVLITFVVFATFYTLPVMQKFYKIRLSYVFVFILMLTLSGVASTIFITDEESSVVRLFSMVIAFREILDYPIFGSFLPSLVQPMYIQGFQISFIHNSWISILHAGGIVIFLLILLIILPSKMKCDQYPTVTFFVLSQVAMNFGGNFLLFPVYWFFVGVFNSLEFGRNA